MKKITNISIIIFIFIILSGKPTFASNMSSTQYKIQYGTVNMGGGNESSTSYKLGVSLGQTAANQFNSTGYTIKAGFQYVNSIIPFAFKISSTQINLGNLTPNTFLTATTLLTVSSGGAAYQVTAQEDRKLTSIAANTISNTVCNGSPNCTKTSAQAWTSTSNDGFGFNMTGNDIPTDFVNSTYFRPFSDKSLGEAAAIVMSRTAAGRDRQATMTFKANVLGAQAAGSYQTVINFVATPIY